MSEETTQETPVVEETTQEVQKPMSFDDGVIKVNLARTKQTSRGCCSRANSQMQAILVSEQKPGRKNSATVQRSSG